MSEGDYARLLEWTKANRSTLEIARIDREGGEDWTISLPLSVPVKFNAYAKASTIDEAAAEVIRQLATVGATISAPWAPDPD